MATSNRTALRYVKETSLKVTPATPALKTLRYTGESLDYNQTFVASDEIRDDRNPTESTKVSSATAGDINIELSLDSFDDIIASIMCSTWSAPVANVKTLKNGTTRDSYTVQKHFQDMTTPAFQNFLGCIFNKLTLDFQNGQIVKGAFGVIGASASIGTAQIAGATFPVASTNMPLNAVSNLQSIERNATAMTTFIKKLGLVIENNARALEAIGSDAAVDIALGAFSVTGSMDLYVSDKTLYDDYITGTPFKFSFKLVDSTGDYLKFTIPKVKFDTGKILSGGSSQDLIMTGTWRASYDSVTTCTVMIERLDAP
jgi:hypothetical protein